MSPTTTGTELTVDEVRTIAINSARLDRVDNDPGRALRDLGIVQLDSINALARAHQLTLATRTTSLTARQIDEALWGGPEPIAFDYPAHALALLPLRDWPLWAFRRRATRRRPDYPDSATARALLRHVEQHGPVTMKDLRGDGDAGDGWNWSPTKTAVEYLVWSGELACTRRTNWQRLFDLPHRVVPAELLTDALDDRQCQLELLNRAGRVLGVATIDDLADYIRIPKPLTRQLLPDTVLRPVGVHGWSAPTWAHPDALERTRPPDRATFLGPFDNLIWHRPRVARLFDFTHTLEAYKPAAQRVHGYYVCPLLVGTRLVGRADLARREQTMTVLRLTLDDLTPNTIDGFVHACHDLARAVGCAEVTIAPNATDDHLRRTLLRSLAGPS
ncbi:winged helix-turn-helix domain-containing protein [Saccharothrix obliqua]|uniref:winged helix-turn-helix domain-containing protein n=1 Tax=Saccharothrix obliqua TaxID=2861747 RepID=UPI001C5F71E8|nr:crosslink repair DNA glycosylase YcaQ family protein [Saccharothrix obliqua]MBW4717316.1 winged helix DNA-binding domain-containing protein [Saccharothrix obliqua]